MIGFFLFKCYGDNNYWIVLTQQVTFLWYSKYRENHFSWSLLLCGMTRNKTDPAMWKKWSQRISCAYRFFVLHRHLKNTPQLGVHQLFWLSLLPLEEPATKNQSTFSYISVYLRKNGPLYQIVNTFYTFFFFLTQLHPLASKLNNNNKDKGQCEVSQDRSNKAQIAHSGQSQHSRGPVWGPTLSWQRFSFIVYFWAFLLDFFLLGHL